MGLPKALKRLKCQWVNTYSLEGGTHSLSGNRSMPRSASHTNSNSQTTRKFNNPYGSAFCAWPCPGDAVLSGQTHKGLINCTVQGQKKVLVLQRRGLTLKDCQHEVDKRLFVMKVLEGAPQCSGIEVVPIYFAKYTLKENHEERDEYVLIRDVVNGQEQELLGPSHPRISDLTEAISATSNYSVQVTSVRGVLEESNSNGQHHVTYKLTSLVVHSVMQQCGTNAPPMISQIIVRGFEKVDTFTDWGNLDLNSESSSRVQPTAPPEYETVVSSQASDNRLQPTAPVMPEDIELSPQGSSDHEQCVCQTASGHESREVYLTRIYGPPPPYTP